MDHVTTELIKKHKRNLAEECTIEQRRMKTIKGSIRGGGHQKTKLTENNQGQSLVKPKLKSISEVCVGSVASLWVNVVVKRTSHQRYDWKVSIHENGKVFILFLFL